MANVRGSGSNVPFDTKSSEGIWDLVVWKRENAETNNEQVARLKKNMAVAIQNELTPHQQRALSMYYLEGLSMPETACTLGVNISTVSRTIKRAKQRLQRALQYTF